MRILLTADPEIPVPPKLYGGIERIVAGLVDGLRALGHEVALAAHPASTACPSALFPWPGQRSNSAWDTVLNARALQQMLWSFQPDVLHSFSRLMYMLPVIRSRLPKIMSYQREPSQRTTTRARRLAGGTLRFTGCSDYICRLGRRAGGDWTTIYNFVDIDRYTFTSTVPADSPLVFLSRVESCKGPHVAIAAAKRTGRRLIIAGNQHSGPAEAEYWRNHIEPHLGKDGIEYVGPVDDNQKNELLGRAAALLVPVQWDEPFGIVFVEALACGTPVISCPRGALPEILQDGGIGFLESSLDGLVAAINRIETVHRSRCRQTAETRFSQPLAIRAYDALHHRAITRPAPSRFLDSRVLLPRR
jgi:glycosyltransferase involved in cell wall biosynthesis